MSEIETVMIDASRIGIKNEIAVPTTYRTVRAALVFNKDVLSLEAGSEGDDPVESLESSIKMFDAVAEYITKTLSLTAKQSDKLLDLNPGELVDFGQAVAAGVLHIENTEATEEDRKSDAE
ncbi:hypothetical protein [Lacticaseibacillus nasuensis]|uniref:hypothetical protein n=1 Tax=Lacticaseibacillus nasuensis TaxID=944671 RepID=UPI002246545A|nr:hypothetical protein [Lacticaseibacillus nasuensis]MCX2455622.1 hypothetical protein [Lacticaseibacillus nasuensis]